MPPAVVHVAGEEFSGRLQQRQVRGLLGDLGEFVHLKLDADLPGDGRKMEAGVGGSPDRHVDGDGVLEGVGRHDVPRQDVPVVELHDRLSRTPGQRDAGPVGGRDEGAVGQRHAERLGQHVHGVGGSHHGTGAAPGAGRVLERGQLLFAHLAPDHLSLRLDEVRVADLFPVKKGGVHGAAAHQDGRDVEPAGGHQHPRRHLVAVGQKHHRVEAVGRDHQLDQIGDHLAAEHGHLHPLVSRGDAVADRDAGKLQRRPPRLGHPQFDRLAERLQVNMAGHHFIEGVDDGHEGFVQILPAVAHGVEQGAVRGAVDSLGDDGTSQGTSG